MGGWTSWLTGQNTGGVKGPSTPAGTSTTAAAPVLAPIVQDPWDLPPFPVDDTDFVTGVLVMNLNTGKVSYTVPSYLCATGDAASRLLQRMQSLPVHAAPTMLDPENLGNNPDYRTTALVPGYIFTTSSGQPLGTILAASLLINFKNMAAYEGDRQIVNTFGDTGFQAKALGYV